MLALGLVATVAICTALRRHELGNRALVLTAELDRLRGAWAKASVNLEAEQKVQARYERFLDRVNAIGEEDQRATWTPALRLLVPPAGAGVIIRRLAIKETADDSGIWSLRVEGDAAGAVPRMIADSYRQALQSSLAQDFQVVEACRLERLEEAGSPSVAPPAKAVGFTMEAKFTLKRGAGSTAGN